MAAIMANQGTGAGMELLGAPDIGIGVGSEDQQIDQAIRIELSSTTVEEIRQCTQSGQATQLSFGKVLALRVGDTSRPLRFSPSFSSSFRYEVYRKAKEEREGKQQLHFAALVSHWMAAAESTKKAETSTYSEEVLKAALASVEKEKMDNSAQFIGKTTISTAKPKTKWKKVNPRPSSFFQNFSTRNPTQQQLQPPPTSAPTNRAKATLDAHRYAIIHFLAMRPVTEDAIVQNTEISKEDLPQLLDKFAQKTGQKSADQKDLWELRDIFYKSLEPWEFKYKSDEDRQSTIDNAIRVYSRQRISTSDELWDRLHPPEKRGKGIVLSKLKLRGDPPGNGVPTGSKPGDASLHGDPKHDSAPDADASASPKINTSTNTEMARKRSAPKATTGTKPLQQSSASTKSTSSKVTKKGKVEKPQDFGDEDEGSSDLEEVLASHSEREKKAARSNGPVAKGKKASAAGNKRKSDGNFKSEEFIEDSSDLIEDDELQAEATNMASANKKLKTNDGAAKTNALKSAVDEKTTKKSATTPADKMAKLNPNKEKSASAPTSKENKSVKPEPKATASRENDASKAGTTKNNPLQTAPTAKPKQATSQQNEKKGSSAGVSMGVSSTANANPSKNTPVHRHSSSQSSVNSVEKPFGTTKKRPGEDGFSPESPPKRRKSEVGPVKASTQSSSPLTNTSDLPSVSSPEQSSPRTTKPRGGIPNDLNTRITSTSSKATTQDTKKASSSEKAPVKTNGIHKPSPDVTPPAKTSSNDTVIESLKKEYSTMFREHITQHLALDQMSPEEMPDQTEYKAKFHELQSLNSTITALLRRSGRGDEPFPNIPDDFSSASVPGLVDYARGKIAGLTKRYGVEREQAESTGFEDERQREQLNAMYDEIKQLEALRDH